MSEEVVEQVAEETSETGKTLDEQIADMEKQEPTIEEVEAQELKEAEAQEAEPEIDYEKLTEEELLQLITEELQENSGEGVKSTPVQDRIDQLTAKRREAERRADQAERELVRLRQVTSGDKEPQQDDFDDYSQFVKAASRWAARQEKVAAKQEELNESINFINESKENFEHARVQEGIDADPAFGMKADKLSKVFTPQHEAYHSLFESEQFVPMVQWLSGNLNEAHRIANLSPRAQAREIMRLEDAIQAGEIQLPKSAGKLTQDSPLSRRTVSSAPAPVKPAGGRETVKKNLDSMSMEEYAAHRKAQQKSRR